MVASFRNRTMPCFFNNNTSSSSSSTSSSEIHSCVNFFFLPLSYIWLFVVFSCMHPHCFKSRWHYRENFQLQGTWNSNFSLAITNHFECIPSGTFAPHLPMVVVMCAWLDVKILKIYIHTGYTVISLSFFLPAFDHSSCEALFCDN